VIVLVLSCLTWGYPHFLIAETPCFPSASPSAAPVAIAVPSLRYYYVLQRVPSLESSLSYNILYIYSYVLYGSILVKFVSTVFFFSCTVFSFLLSAIRTLYSSMDGI